MRQPGNRDRKVIPRVEPITGDVNIHSVTALKRLPGVIGPSPERLHTDSWWPVQFPAPSLNDFDFEVIPIHADPKLFTPSRAGARSSTTGSKPKKTSAGRRRNPQSLNRRT